MEIITYNNNEQELLAKFTRKSLSVDIEQSVKEILSDIKDRQDEAIIEYALKFDQQNLTCETFCYQVPNIEYLEQVLDKNIRLAIDESYQNITTFAEQKIPQDWQFSPRDGVVLGEKFDPIESVLCYIPGGSAPLISTVLHTATLAKVAKVKNIYLSTKMQNGVIHPAICYAAYILGIKEIYTLSGVYAIGAFAYGTDTIPKVDKIVGPGNAYVASAKKQVYGDVSLDLVAGPSEIMIIAEENSNAKFIASDLLSQAEHGSSLEQAVLVSESKTLLEKVKQEIDHQKTNLTRRFCIDKVLENGVFLIQVDSIEEASTIANLYAPEHLQLIGSKAEKLINKISNAGAIFVGEYTPESVGDFVAGPSHVLPTEGSARFFNGLTIEQFFSRTSIISYSKDALYKEKDFIASLALAEGLDAHAKSATIRFD